MAREDYEVADRAEFSLTAGDKVAETIQETPDAETQSFADAAGVSHPAYVGYVAALDAHAARDDIEGLRERRLREYGDSFVAGEFMRQAAYNADGSTADAPRPGTLHGYAPDATGQSTTALANTIPTDTDEDGTFEGAGEGTDPTP